MSQWMIVIDVPKHLDTYEKIKLYGNRGEFQKLYSDFGIPKELVHRLNDHGIYNDVHLMTVDKQYDERLEVQQYIAYWIKSMREAEIKKREAEIKKRDERKQIQEDSQFGIEYYI